MAATRDRIADMKPYVERAMKDEELRDSLKSAFAAFREVYDELGGRPRATATTLATRLATDKDIQDNLRSAIEDLRTAARRVQGKESHKGRNMTLLLAGIAIGVFFNPITGPDTRRWLKDTLFGAEDEFGYQGGGSSGGSDNSGSSGGGGGGGS